MSLLEKLAGDLGALHFAQIESLNAQAERTDAAEQLAQRLQSCGINTIATGRIGPDGAAMIWLSANTSMPRIQEALAKINVVATDPADHGHPIGRSLYAYVLGDVPIYATQPPEQATA